MARCVVAIIDRGIIDQPFAITHENPLLLCGIPASIKQPPTQCEFGDVCLRFGK